ncbi:MAG: hypothetical protein Q9193_001432, partial [Seirophora villosa]
LWSQQALVQPLCVFVPVNVQQVASAIKILVATNTSFTPRSGGHMPVRGHASTQFGVMIATSRFTSKSITRLPNSLDYNYISAGPAFRWQEIYEFLNPTGFLVAGGRVSSVGSSLLLGGGLSYLSSSLGWAANNVIQYELVTAKGEILYVSQKKHADLFWALKGGSNNFGIVTRYDMRLFPSTAMYGGTVVWPANATRQYLKAQTDFILPGGGSYDDNAAIMPNFNYNPQTKTPGAGSVVFYNAPVDKPKALENFTAIPLESGGAKVQNYSEITATTFGYAGTTLRWSFYNTALLSTVDTMDIIYNTTTGLADEMLSGVNCSVGSATQPITVNHLKAARAAGGDAIDLDPARGAFSFTDRVLASIEQQAKARGIYYPWLFLNDAGITQDPISTYGYGASLPRLRAVSRKYDPKGIFQQNVPGFKLGYELHGY